MDFERFIGIDWSGAETDCNAGIRLAQIDRQTNHLELMPAPNGRNWGRGDVLTLLKSVTDRRTLVGLDFAFSVPWHDGEGSIPACLSKLGQVRDLWALIDHCCKNAADFYGGPIWLSDESPFRPFIRLWSHAINYQREVVGACLLRKTERAAMDEGLRPLSVYRMTGPQVGAGSFAGMRVLHALGQSKNSSIAIWPFDPIGNAKMVVVEMYPSAFYKMARQARPTKRQLKTGAHVKAAVNVLEFFGAHYKSDIPQSVDAIDALISAAAIQSLSETSVYFNGPNNDDISCREGWIFGVPFGVAA